MWPLIFQTLFQIFVLRPNEPNQLFFTSHERNTDAYANRICESFRLRGRFGKGQIVGITVLFGHHISLSPKCKVTTPNSSSYGYSVFKVG